MVAVQSDEPGTQVAASFEGVERAHHLFAESAFPFLESGALLLVKRPSMGRQAFAKAATHVDAGGGIG